MKHALIVDDSPTMRRILKKGLVPLGFEAFTDAASGWEALRTLNEAHVDLVVTDWNMPGISGPDLVGAIRMNPRVHRLPVLMVTSNSRSSDVLDALEAGVDDYLVKPFDMTTLQRKVRSLLDVTNDAAASACRFNQRSALDDSARLRYVTEQPHGRKAFTQHSTASHPYPQVQTGD